ncbi:MAG: class III poly(R)-hydroxyalkanoic acid synthase subunit PhaC [Gammaproteobacteria bacterium]
MPTRMTDPFNLDAGQTRAELAELNRRIALGIQTLAETDVTETGVSEREMVLAQDKVCLYRYQSAAGITNTTPVLIVYALVNRPYMVDLEQGRSLIQTLSGQGLDIYMLDWGYPGPSDQATGLYDYIAAYIDTAVDFIREQHGIDKINLLGICQGGTLSLCYSSLYQHKIANLVTTVTPVDFQTEQDLLSHLVQKVDIDLCIEALGNVPGAFLNWIFLMLKPYSLLGRKYLEMLDEVEDVKKTRSFMRMEKWIFDSPDQAGTAYREFIRYFYQQNRLVKGELQLGGKDIDLRSLTLPILNIYAKRDHLVPPAASRALSACIGSSDYTEVELDCGHIGLYVSRSSQDKLAPLISRWLGVKRG